MNEQGVSELESTHVAHSAGGEAGKYVYCIIKSQDEREFGPIGIGEAAGRVYTVHHQDLAAVVSDTPIRIYDPTRENVLAHELVNETVMREFTVIPKNSLHPGLETEFDAWLDAHPELRTAIVVGNCTDLCVYSLAMHLRMRHNARNIAGVSVIVPANAVQTYDLPVETAAEIGAMAHPGDFFHEVFLYHMALNGIDVVRELT